MNTSNKDSIEEALRTPARINKKKATAKHIIVKLLKKKKPTTKKKLLKLTEKKTHYLQRSTVRLRLTCREQL